LIVVTAGPQLKVITPPPLLAVAQRGVEGRFGAARRVAVAHDGIGGAHAMGAATTIRTAILRASTKSKSNASAMLLWFGVEVKKHKSVRSLWS
jgi:hypothetical protein